MGKLNKLLEKYMELANHYEYVTIAQIVGDLRNLQSTKARIVQKSTKEGVIKPIPYRGKPDPGAD